MYTSIVVSILALASTILSSPVHQNHQHQQLHVEKRARETVVDLVTVTELVTLTDGVGAASSALATSSSSEAAAGADNINGGPGHLTGGGGHTLSTSTSAVVVTTSTPVAVAPSQDTSVASVVSSTSSSSSSSSSVAVQEPSTGAAQESSTYAAQSPSTLITQGTTTTSAAGNNGGTITSSAAATLGYGSGGDSGATQISDHSALTVYVVNSMDKPISTMVVPGADASPIVSGSTAPGTLAASQTGTFVFPRGWNGNIPVNNGSAPLMPDASLIEPALNLTSGTIDVDVSYVDGFTVPIVCQCHTSKSETDVFTGCNIDLWSKSTCTTGMNAGGMCMNPLRENNNPPPITPEPFFSYCLHAAFTYPQDPGPNHSGICLTNEVTCCVGSACPPNPMNYDY